MAHHCFLMENLMKRLFFLLAVILGSTISYAGEDAPAPQIVNVPGRHTISLDGLWKTIVDPFIGRYSLIKVCSGVFKTDETVYDSGMESELRIGKLYIMMGNKTTEVPELHAGDLGAVGHGIVKELFRKDGIELGPLYIDCGMLIYNTEAQDVHAGGSGCGCSAVTLSAYILKQLEEGVWKRVLFVPTGALLSKTSYNEGQSVPGIAHAVELVSCVA